MAERAGWSLFRFGFPHSGYRILCFKFNGFLGKRAKVALYVEHGFRWITAVRAYIAGFDGCVASVVRWLLDAWLGNFEGRIWS
jgi:hypothetical protein